MDDYFTTLAYQVTYRPENPFEDLIIVKKDNATTDLIAKNPSRKDFASLFSFLGNQQTRKARFSSSSRRIPLFQLSVGLLNARGVPEGLHILPMIDTSYDTWYCRKQHYDKIIKSYSDDLDWHGMVIFKEYLFRHFGFNNLLSSFGSSGRRNAIQDTINNWPWEGNKESPEAQRVLGYWVLFLMNMIIAELEPELYFFPQPGVLFNFELGVSTPGLSSELYVEPASVVAFDFVLHGKTVPEYDKILRKAIASSSADIVLAAYQGLEDEVTVDQEHESIAVEAQRRGEAAPSITGEDLRERRVVERYIRPEEDFVSDPVRLGMINIRTGNRDFVTHAPIFVINRAEQKLEPSFALISAMIYLDNKSLYETGKKAGYVDEMYLRLEEIYEDAVNRKHPRIFRVKDVEIPVNRNGEFFIDYVGSTVRAYSFPGSGLKTAEHPGINSLSMYECFSADTLKKYYSLLPHNEELNPSIAHSRSLDVYRNKGRKIIMAGPFELSDLDYYPTPMNMQTAFRMQTADLMGVEIHANAFLNIIKGRALAVVNDSLIIALLFISSFVLALALQIMSPFKGLIFVLVSLAGVFGWSCYSYVVLRQVFRISTFVLAWPSIWSLHTFYNYFLQKAKAQKTKKMFSRFVAADVVSYMLENPQLVKPGGQKVELTVFFSDVAGFTSISESLSPEELVILLNEYLGAMTDLLFEYGGTLDKFIGDAVMAFWNYPKKQSDHALKACLCALSMQKKIDELQQSWRERGFPEIKARAGLNTADVVVGYMGSERGHMNFTCMGDGVNLAARLEGANKEYQTDLMISEFTYEQVKDSVVTRFLDLLAVKGKAKPVKVFELVAEKGCEPPYWNELSQKYHKAIDLHLNRKWEKAIELFEEILEKWPEDGPSATYLKRCRQYQNTPPPENWDGRYIMTTK